VVVKLISAVTGMSVHISCNLCFVSLVTEEKFTVHFVMKFGLSNNKLKYVENIAVRIVVKKK